MVSIYSRKKDLNNPENEIIVFGGLSTETKPTDNVGNGSFFICIDNGDIYSFDGTTETWNKIS